MNIIKDFIRLVFGASADSEVSNTEAVFVISVIIIIMIILVIAI